MRERPSPRTPLSFLFARDAARRAAAFLATLGLASAGIAFGATSAAPFQVAYMYGTSGPSGGGTAINLVGNQFLSGATVKIGGVGVGASVTSSTRIGVTSPALAPGALYDVIVTNTGGSSGVLPKGWFADFRDVAASSPFHAPVETIIRDGITSGCGGGNYCPSSSVTRAQMAVFLLRAGHGSGYVPPPGDRDDLRRRRRRATSRPTGSSSFTPEGITGGCSDRNPAALLPEQRDHARPDGRLPPQDLPRHRLCAASGAGRLQRRADLAAARALDRGARPAVRHERVRRHALLPRATPSRAARWPSSSRRPSTARRPTRFLEQATWGPKDSEISGMLGVGYLPWMASQYSLAPLSRRYPNSMFPLWPGDTPDSCDDTCYRDNYSSYRLQNRFFTNALYRSGPAASARLLGAPQDGRDLDEQRHAAEPVHPVPQHPGERTRSATTGTSSRSSR